MVNMQILKYLLLEIFLTIIFALKIHNMIEDKFSNHKVEVSPYLYGFLVSARKFIKLTVVLGEEPCFRLGYIDLGDGTKCPSKLGSCSSF